MLKPFFYLLLTTLFLSACEKQKNSHIIADNETATTIYLSENSDPLVSWAAHDLATSLSEITGEAIQVVNSTKIEDNNEHAIVIGSKGHQLLDQTVIPNHELEGEWEKFIIRSKQNTLYITGSDVRGTVYGIFDLAEEVGISPWKWWADVKPRQQSTVTINLPEGGIVESPSVQYRGIFLNDEDWGLQPWAAKNFEPETGDIGPKTYEKIFQLLLRLKANTIWPAMHHCTQAFYTIEGNKEMAAKYNMVIGTSHAEPMLRNNVDEWDRKERGDYNYFTNSEAVNKYWEERIQGVSDSQNKYLITVGMRGIHDGKMEGNATTEEKVEALETIIKNQRDILQNTLNKPAENVPQVLVPYKEVLSLYNSGLEVPDDVTLMWTDDNYGYIRRLSNEQEQQRSGGSGVYYHVSYWGRPHDYLWLSTTQPSLIWFEMKRAYENGAQKVWIENVGDIKPAEYNMEFFLDMAWNIDVVKHDNISSHLVEWAAREFGKEQANEIASLMNEYYRLAFLRKPEFMGWSQTEPNTPTHPTDFTKKEAQKRLKAYRELYLQSEKLKENIDNELHDAYFQLVEYPVKGAALMNEKFLNAHLAYLAVDDAEEKQLHQKAQKAYEEIASLTSFYNEKLKDGKWKEMMDMKPRNLAAYQMPDYHLKSDPENTAAETTEKPVYIQASSFSSASGQNGYEWNSIDELGYSGSAVTLLPLENNSFETEKPQLTYKFSVPEAGKYKVEVRCLPTHSNQFDHQLGLSIDGDTVSWFDLNTRGRSWEWKQNVLRNHTKTIKEIEFEEAGEHQLDLSVNQTGIVIDQIAVYPNNLSSI